MSMLWRTVIGVKDGHAMYAGPKAAILELIRVIAALMDVIMIFVTIAC